MSCRKVKRKNQRTIKTKTPINIQFWGSLAMTDYSPFPPKAFAGLPVFPNKMTQLDNS